VGCALPASLRALLAQTAGLERPFAVDFTGREAEYEDREVFPYGLPMTADGFGNFWGVDLREPPPGPRAAVRNRRAAEEARPPQPRLRVVGAGRSAAAPRVRWPLHPLRRLRSSG
jgi:hypothetical protein